VKLGKRKLINWLKTLQEYVEDTEAPRDFWLWGGLFTISAALQRRVWLPYGLEPVYPNLYVMLVAPPGKCRKAGPLTLAKKMLKKTGIPVSKDSFSKRALTQEMAELYKTEHFTHEGKMYSQTPMAIISKEMSSLLAVDPVGIVKLLTDLYDCHDEWDYGTSGKGEDILRNVATCAFIATTPTSLATDLPSEAIGQGFTSRIEIITGYDTYKDVPIPSQPDNTLYEKLLSDLSIIAMITGEFTWTKEAQQYFIGWYMTLKSRIGEIKDERLHSFLSRIHVAAIKVSMAIHIAYSNELVIELKDLEGAVELLESVLATASDALGGHGRSVTAIDVELIMRQIKHRGQMTFNELLSINYRNTNKLELLTVLDTIVAMGVVENPRVSATGVTTYRWIKGE